MTSVREGKDPAESGISGAVYIPKSCAKAMNGWS